MGFWDHPRIRGEKCLLEKHKALGKGSPPHTRGKGELTKQAQRRHGITPAYAGKSQFSGGEPVSVRDHPRIRGEKYIWDAHIHAFAGSPPHTRGKGGGQEETVCGSGITPAYAGKSLIMKVYCMIAGDHPRIRGEKLLTNLHILTRKGSPPHTRGKAQWYVALQWSEGITPAYAGKRTTPATIKMQARDHPRIRGEKLRRCQM